MKTMLDILRERLPEGLEIIKVHDKSGSSQIKVDFSYNGTETVGYLYKTCAPGQAERNCDFIIYSTMISIGLKNNDLYMAQEWMKKQDALMRGGPENGEAL